MSFLFPLEKLLGSREMEKRDFLSRESVSYNFGNFLLNGILGFYVNRNVVLEATYNGLANQALTGKYPGETSFSSDIGISFGVLKKPFFLLGRITYPIYTGGSDDRLTDNNPDKIKQLEQYIPISERVPLELPLTEHNVKYMETKKQRFGHYLTIFQPYHDPK